MTIDAPAVGAPTMGHVPDTFAQAILLSRYQFRDYLRSRRFILMLSIVAVIGAILNAKESISCSSVARSDG